jgi:hypothetical protein
MYIPGFQYQSYKKRFWLAIGICLFMMAGSFAAHFYGVRLIKEESKARLYGDILFYGSLAIAFYQAWRHQQRLRVIWQLPTLEERLTLHNIGSQKRCWQSVASVAITCFLLLLTGKKAFIFYSFFDLLNLLMLYPFNGLLKRELGVS